MVLTASTISEWPLLPVPSDGVAGCEEKVCLETVIREQYPSNLTIGDTLA
jgi:hypothetical protein